MSLSVKAAANAAFGAGDYARAEALYSRALELAAGGAAAGGPPDGATATMELRGTLLANRSAARLQLGDAEGARADGAEAARLRPDWPKARARLGAALMALHRAGEAAEALRAGGAGATRAGEGGALLGPLLAAAESAAAWAAALPRAGGAGGGSGGGSGGAAAAPAAPPPGGAPPRFAPILRHSLSRLPWLPPELARSCRAGPWTLTGPISRDEGESLAGTWGASVRAGLAEAAYIGRQEEPADASGRPVDVVAKMMARMRGGPVSLGPADRGRGARVWAHMRAALPRSAAATRRFVRLAARACCIEPPIWRRVVVPVATSLHALADRVLLTAFGLGRGVHTYAFHLPPAAYPGHRLPPFDEDVCFTPRGASTIDRMHAWQLRGNETEVASQDVLACDVLREAGDALRFTYDFGDKWRLAVELEDADAPAPAPRGRLAQLLGGARAGLPENPGSPLAHFQRLAAIAAARPDSRARREAAREIAESATNLDLIQPPPRRGAPPSFDAEFLDAAAVQARLDDAMLELGGRTYAGVLEGGGGSSFTPATGEAVSRRDGLEAGLRGAHACAHCARSTERPNFCAACREVCYCDAACQRAHWKAGHKLACVRAGGGAGGAGGGGGGEGAGAGAGGGLGAGGGSGGRLAAADAASR